MRKGAKRGWLQRYGLRLFSYLLLLAFLAFSIVTVMYVVFFQTAIAAESKEGGGPAILFEEPDPPPPELLPEIGELQIRSSRRLARAKVAIIIDDLGYHRDLDFALLQLDLPLTYSFLPGAPYTPELLGEADRLNKLIFLHLPLEAKDPKWNTGKETLFLTDSRQTQLDKFHAALALVPGAVGVNNHMGSLYTEDPEAMKALLQEIAKSSLVFIDSFTTANSKGLGLAREMGLATARRHVFLDNVLDEDSICQQLDNLGAIALEKGAAIGIGHPHPQTLAALENCIGHWQEKVDFIDARLYLSITADTVK